MGNYIVLRRRRTVKGNGNVVVTVKCDDNVVSNCILLRRRKTVARNGNMVVTVSKTVI